MTWQDFGQMDRANFLYLFALLLIVMTFSLPLRRIGIGRIAGYALAWSAIFGLGWVALEHNPNAVRYIERLSAAEMVTDVPAVKGAEVRVEAALDGHYWVRARVNGVPVRFLVDTGASDVVLSQATAAHVGIDVAALHYDHPGISASGHVEAADARVDRLAIGGIVRTDMPVSIIPGADINLLGMRFLSSLDGWRVEQGELVLRS